MHAGNGVTSTGYSTPTDTSTPPTPRPPQSLEPIQLWAHPDPRTSRMWHFLELVNAQYGLHLTSYDDLYQWSIENIGPFWAEVWSFTGVKAAKAFDNVRNFHEVTWFLIHVSKLEMSQVDHYVEARFPPEMIASEALVGDPNVPRDKICPVFDSFLFLAWSHHRVVIVCNGNMISTTSNWMVVLDNTPMFPRPDFFSGSLLNFAENLLYPANIDINEHSAAIIEATEVGHSSITWAELRERVRRCALGLRHQGVQSGDRVAGFLGNHANTVIAMLASASIGAIWTGVSPDTGVTAVLERLVQIAPVLIFVDNAVFYNGKVHPSHEKVVEIVKGLEDLKAVVMFETIVGQSMRLEGLESGDTKAWRYEDFVKRASNQDLPLEFTNLPPSHPLYVLYSSGTTGAPKCIVHSAVGTLLQHKKEHILHCDICPGDRVFYFTTTTWMMWHWLVSALASGATIILYDGSPFHPHGSLSMPRLIQDLQITHFGTSAKYLSILEQKSVRPLETIDLSSLKAIYSTGSPLAPSTFQYIYATFPPSINLGSITGGTDIISLFGAPSPLVPVYAGEIQVKGLGMAIAAFSPSGMPVPDGQEGDLVCTKPFPSQPTTFWSGTNESAGAAKYRASYFELFPGLWHHGDFVRFSAKTGGMTMLGRSDGILKPSGVRFGSAEIYNLLLQHFGPEVQDAICVGRRREGETDEVVVLFLKMESGKKCDEVLKAKIRKVVRRELSARHVPGVVDECFEIPVTGNGKKVEIAVKQILCGMNIKIGASVANQDCLEWYRVWATEH